MIEWPKDVSDEQLGDALRGCMSGMSNIGAVLLCRTHGYVFTAELAAISTFIDTCQRLQHLIILTGFTLLKDTELSEAIADQLTYQKGLFASLKRGAGFENFEEKEQCLFDIVNKKTEIPSEQQSKYLKEWETQLALASFELSSVSNLIEVNLKLLDAKDDESAKTKEYHETKERFHRLAGHVTTLMTISANWGNPGQLTYLQSKLMVCTL